MDITPYKQTEITYQGLAECWVVNIQGEYESAIVWRRKSTTNEITWDLDSEETNGIQENVPLHNKYIQAVLKSLSEVKKK